LFARAFPHRHASHCTFTPAVLTSNFSDFHHGLLGLKVFEVVLIAGASGALLAWRKDRREKHQLILAERDDARKERDDARKAHSQALAERDDIRKELALVAQERKTAWEQAFQLSKQTRDALDDVAVRVADTHYRPVIDAIARVNSYAETYTEIVAIIDGVQLLKAGKPLPSEMMDRDREFLRNPDQGTLDEKLKAMQEGLAGCADILTMQLRDLDAAVTQFIRSGHVSELEGSISRECMVALLNVHNAGRIKELVKKPDTETISHFLRDWAKDWLVSQKCQVT
jgi:hypothetical protein